MIRLFKDLRVLYLTISSGLGVILAVILVMLGVNDIVSLCIVAAWILAWYFFFGKLANDRAANINKLRENCKIKEFINLYKNLVSAQKQGSIGAVLARLNLSAGLLDYGDVEGAANVMSQIQLPNNKNARTPLGTVYHNNYSLIFIRKGDIQSAQQALNASRELLETGKVNEKEYVRLKYYNELRQAQIYICAGDADHIEWARSVMERYVNNTNVLLEKVAGNYWLARICYALGEKDEEIRRLKCIEENGGDTIYYLEAKNILRDYEEQNLLANFQTEQSERAEEIQQIEEAELVDQTEQIEQAEEIEQEEQYGDESL